MLAPTAAPQLPPVPVMPGRRRRDEEAGWGLGSVKGPLGTGGREVASPIGRCKGANEILKGCKLQPQNVFPFLQHS